MNRQEFVGALERTLRGAGASEALILDNINYYSSYFQDEMRKGRSEEEIAKELGDPRLIAKTIIGVLEEDGYSEESGAYEEDLLKRQREAAEDNRQDDRGFRAEFGENGWDIRIGRFKINSWYGYLLIAVIVFSVISLLLAIIGGIFSLIAPILILVLVIFLVIRLFSGRK